MSAPRTLEEARAQCRALGVDLRVSGAGMSACMDLLAPFCPHGTTSATGEELPGCLGEPPSARKAAILASEAMARARGSEVVAMWPMMIASGLVGTCLVAWWHSRQ